MRSIIQSGLNTVPVADLIFYDPRFRMCALWVGGVCVFAANDNRKKNKNILPTLPWRQTIVDYGRMV